MTDKAEGLEQRARCGNCRFWKRTPGLMMLPTPDSKVSESNFVGTCRNKPPNIEGWPSTLDSDYCGYYIQMLPPDESVGQ